MLGDVWTAYIESVPSRKRSAITKTIQAVAPISIAVGGTMTVFVPRILFANRYRPVGGAPPQGPQQQRRDNVTQMPPRPQAAPSQQTQNNEPPPPPKGASGHVSPEQYDMALEVVNDYDEYFDAFI